MPQSGSIGTWATLACLWEVAAPKPGNVYRGADFEDLTFVDLVASGAAIAPALEAAPRQSVGETVQRAIEATRQVVATNSNLGIVLLLAPLAKVPLDVPLAEGIGPVLDALTVDDARRVYAAIRLAKPGGLGKSAEADVSDEPTISLRAAMGLAAKRDLVARQYVTNFEDVLARLVPWLLEARGGGASLSEAIVRTQLRFMSQFPDSLIMRKCGAAVAAEALDRAAQVLSSGGPGDEAYERALSDFDFWLRADGHRRNPGATADLIAAALFAALRDGQLATPAGFYPHETGVK